MGGRAEVLGGRRMAFECVENVYYDENIVDYVV